MNKLSLDAIALKRRIQAEIIAETRHLTPRERLTYFKQQVQNGPFKELLATVNDHHMSREISPQPQSDLSITSE